MIILVILILLALVVSWNCTRTHTKSSPDVSLGATAPEDHCVPCQSDVFTCGINPGGPIPTGQMQLVTWDTQLLKAGNISVQNLEQRLPNSPFIVNTSGIYKVKLALAGKAQGGSDSVVVTPQLSGSAVNDRWAIPWGGSIWGSSSTSAHWEGYYKLQRGQVTPGEFALTVAASRGKTAMFDNGGQITGMVYAPFARIEFTLVKSLEF